MFFNITVADSTMCSKHTEKTKLHVQPTRNTRNFILGTCSLLSADFYKLFIHLVEGNTRIAERKQLAQHVRDLMSCGLVHPENRTIDFGFSFNDIKVGDFSKFEEAYKQKKLSTARLKQLYIERLGPGQFGAFHIFELIANHYEAAGKICDPSSTIFIDQLGIIQKLNSYPEFARLSHMRKRLFLANNDKEYFDIMLTRVIFEILSYEAYEEEYKIEKFDFHTKLCDRTIAVLLYNERKNQVRFITEYDYEDYIDEKLYTDTYIDHLGRLMSREKRYKEKGVLFYVYVDRDHWVAWKALVNSYSHILNGTLDMDENIFVFTPE